MGEKSKNQRENVCIRCLQSRIPQTDARKKYNLARASPWLNPDDCSSNRTAISGIPSVLDLDLLLSAKFNSPACSPFCGLIQFGNSVETSIYLHCFLDFPGLLGTKNVNFRFALRFKSSPNASPLCGAWKYKGALAEGDQEVILAFRLNKRTGFWDSNYCIEIAITSVAARGIIPSAAVAMHSDYAIQITLSSQHKIIHNNP